MIGKQIHVKGIKPNRFQVQGRFTKEEELAIWEYLKDKLSFFGDNNKTAREIFNRITK